MWSARRRQLPSKEIQPGGSLTVLKAGEIAGFDPVHRLQLGRCRWTGKLSRVRYVALHSGWHYQGPDRGLADLDGRSRVDLEAPSQIKFTDGTPYDCGRS